MYLGTFMVPGTLYERACIHAYPNITCLYEHSWGAMHFILLFTFMILLTLHAPAYIHAL